MRRVVLLRRNGKGWRIRSFSKWTVDRSNIIDEENRAPSRILRCVSTPPWFHSNNPLEYGSSSVAQSFYSISGFSILLVFVHYSLFLCQLCSAFPIFLTTWHLIFATISTQILARTTNLLDGVKTVQMDGKTYLRAIVPIGVFFCFALIFSNQAYFYLSVAFIQMLKVSTLPSPKYSYW